MKRALVALALACSCTPPFQGSYQGRITGTVACANPMNDPMPESVFGTVTISQVNNAIAGFGFGCEFWGTVSKSTASLTIGACDPSYDGVDGMPPAIQTDVSLTGGTLTLDGSLLGLTLVGTELGEAGNPNGCAVTFSGSPLKQQQ